MKINRNNVLSLLFAGSLAATAAGCVGADLGVGLAVDVPLPPPRAEVVLSRPGPDYVWIDGYWDYVPAQRDWVWIEGRWDRPPSRHDRWVRPRYDRRGGHTVYHRGHWRD